METRLETTLRYIVLTLVTRKQQVVFGRSTYYFTIGNVYFCVKAGFEIQLVSYASKQASQSLSDKSFVRIQCF